jgi:hypothetical protein
MLCSAQMRIPILGETFTSLPFDRVDLPCFFGPRLA